MHRKIRILLETNITALIIAGFKIPAQGCVILLNAVIYEITWFIQC